jgi:hypothetical protein
MWKKNMSKKRNKKDQKLQQSQRVSGAELLHETQDYALVIDYSIDISRPHMRVYQIINKATAVIEYEGSSLGHALQDLLMESQPLLNEMRKYIQDNIKKEEPKAGKVVPIH